MGDVTIGGMRVTKIRGVRAVLPHSNKPASGGVIAKERVTREHDSPREPMFSRFPNLRNSPRQRPYIRSSSIDN